MDIGKEADPYVIEPIEDPVPGRERTAPPEPGPAPAAPTPVPERDPVPTP